MRAFIVPQGTEARYIKEGPGQEWHIAENWTKRPTCCEHVFFTEELALDPVGQLGCRRGYTIGGDYERKGYYGFTRDGWVMVVHASYVTVS